MTDGNELIAPLPEPVTQWSSSTQSFEQVSPDYSGGLTKREMFAAAALNGLMAHVQSPSDIEFMAERAVLAADALIKELNREANQ